MRPARPLGPNCVMPGRFCVTPEAQQPPGWLAAGPSAIPIPSLAFSPSPNCWPPSPRKMRWPCGTNSSRSAPMAMRGEIFITAGARSPGRTLSTMLLPAKKRIWPRLSPVGPPRPPPKRLPCSTICRKPCATSAAWSNSADGCARRSKSSSPHVVGNVKQVGREWCGVTSTI